MYAIDERLIKFARAGRRMSHNGVQLVELPGTPDQMRHRPVRLLRIKGCDEKHNRDIARITYQPIPRKLPRMLSIAFDWHALTEAPRQVGNRLEALLAAFVPHCKGVIYDLARGNAGVIFAAHGEYPASIQWSPEPLFNTTPWHELLVSNPI